MFLAAKSRAKAKGLDFTISKEDICIPELCPILSVPFEVGTPYAPSLDRIDSSRGYTPDNIMVVTRKANVMKNNATREELERFATWVKQLTP